MSWIDRIKQDLEITTGDGRVWKPLWKDAEKAIGFNTEGYEFIGIEGTYVERKLSKGNQIPIEFFFQGENCIEEYESFEISAKDPRPWTIIHPFYGQLLVQPISMQVDHKTLNQSRVQVTVWETIDVKYPVEKADINQLIVTTKTNLDNFINNSLAYELEDVTSSSISRFDEAIKKVGGIFDNLPMSQDEFSEFKNRLRLASGAVTNVLARADLFVQATISLINFPLILAENVKFIVDKLSDSINSLFDILFNKEYKSYESFVTTAISCACQSISTLANSPENTRADLAILQSKLVAIYNTHIERIDVPPEGSELLPDFEMSKQLDLIVNLTISQLYEIALNAKQERIIELMEDANLVVLAKQYYGGGDTGMENLLKNNSISLDDYLIVKKGKELIYYV